MIEYCLPFEDTYIISNNYRKIIKKLWEIVGKIIF